MSHTALVSYLGARRKDDCSFKCFMFFFYVFFFGAGRELGGRGTRACQHICIRPARGGAAILSRPAEQEIWVLPSGCLLLDMENL